MEGGPRRPRVYGWMVAGYGEALYALGLLIGTLMLIGPWALGGFLGWRWGGTRLGAVAAVALGLVLTAAGLAAFLLTAPPSAEEACGEDECVRYFGRWLEATLARVWPVYTAITWSASAVYFSWVRRADGRRLGRPMIVSWAMGLLGLAVLGYFFLRLILYQTN